MDSGWTPPPFWKKFQKYADFLFGCLPLLKILDTDIQEKQRRNASFKICDLLTDPTSEDLNIEHLVYKYYKVLAKQIEHQLKDFLK